VIGQLCAPAALLIFPGTEILVLLGHEVEGAAELVWI